MAQRTTSNGNELVMVEAQQKVEADSRHRLNFKPFVKRVGQVAAASLVGTIGYISYEVFMAQEINSSKVGVITAIESAVAIGSLLYTMEPVQNRELQENPITIDNRGDIA